jgi:WD40 repeat protein
MLKVYIAENASAKPELVDVSPDVPVAALAPALVKEFHLPQIDRSGNHLVYILRHATEGWALPEGLSLREANIQAGTFLTLDPYVADEPFMLAEQARAATSQDSGFYHEKTIVDADAFASFSNSAAPPFVATSVSEKRWARRAFVLSGGVALGIVGAGLGYAAFRSLSGSLPMMSQQPASVVVPARKAIVTDPTPFVPKNAQSLLVFAQHRDPVHSVAWSPAGNVLASGSSDKSLLIWNLAGQIQMRHIQQGTVHALAWSPDAQQLAAAATNQVIFFNAQSGAIEARAAHTHTSTVTTLAWSTQEPQFLVSGGLDKLAVVWNTQNFQPQTFFRLHSTGVLSTVWSSAGDTVCSCSEGGAIRVWNGANGQQIHDFFSDKGEEMLALAFEPHGLSLAGGGADGVLRLWTNSLVCQLAGSGQTQGQCLDQPLRLHGHTHAIRALAWSPDGRFLASAGEDGMLFIWYPAQSQTPLLSIPHTSSLLSLSWSPDGKKLAAASGKIVTLWALS